MTTEVNLYRKNNFGQPCVWGCYYLPNDNYITVFHGILGKSITNERIYTTRKLEDECKSRINAKRKVGYKYLSEIKDDNVTSPVEGETLISYLNTYLPDYRTTTDGTLLPMLAKTYTPNVFNKCSIFYGQPKINGLRCFVSAERDEINLFKPIRLKFQSREGTYWNSLYDLEDYLLEVLDKELLNKMVEEHYILDGELYLPGHTVNEINHFVKDPTCKENTLIQYWCYDLAIENTTQYKRFNILREYCNNDFVNHINKLNHYNFNERFLILDIVSICDNEDAIAYRDLYIENGFEGLILRNPDVEYQFGKRNQSMIKFKKATDGKFKVVAIYPEGIKRPDIPLLLCANDINDKTFEVHVNGSHEYQKSILREKDKYIGKTLFITFGERSGVDNLPFHVKEVYFID